MLLFDKSQSPHPINCRKQFSEGVSVTLRGGSKTKRKVAQSQILKTVNQKSRTRS